MQVAVFVIRVWRPSLHIRWKFRFENSPILNAYVLGRAGGVGVGERGLCRNVGSYKKRWRSVVLPYHAFLRLTVDALSGDRNGAGAGGANRECICLELQPYNTHDAVKSINTPSTVDSLCACRHRAPATRYCTAPPGWPTDCRCLLPLVGPHTVSTAHVIRLITLHDCTIIGHDIACSGMELLKSPPDPF